MPTLETNINKGWSTDMYAIDHLQGSSRTRHWAPTVWVRQIAVQTAINAAIGAIPAPAPNSSYSLTIPGPALACNYASEDQQRKFEEHHYKHSVTWSTGPEQRQYERSLLVSLENHGHRRWKEKKSPHVVACLTIEFCHSLLSQTGLQRLRTRR